MRAWIPPPDVRDEDVQDLADHSPRNKSILFSDLILV